MQYALCVYELAFKCDFSKLKKITESNSILTHFDDFLMKTGYMTEVIVQCEKNFQFHYCRILFEHKYQMLKIIANRRFDQNYSKLGFRRSEHFSTKNSISILDLGFKILY